MKIEEKVDQLFDTESRREAIRNLKKQNSLLMPVCWILFAISIFQMFISLSQGAVGLVIFALMYHSHETNKSELRQLLILERLVENEEPTSRSRTTR